LAQAQKTKTDMARQQAELENKILAQGSYCYHSSASVA